MGFSISMKNYQVVPDEKKKDDKIYNKQYNFILLFNYIFIRICLIKTNILLHFFIIY